MSTTTPRYTRQDTARPTRTWSRHHVVWGGALMAVGLVLGLTVTTLGAGTTGELALDRDIAGDRPAAIVDIARFFNVAASPGVAAAVLAVVCLALWAMKSLRTAIVFGALTSVGWLSSLIGKTVVQRARPPQSVHPLVLETGRDSFPSGHTAVTAAFVAATVACLWLAGRSTRTAVLVGSFAVVAVGASRLVLGAHFLADVVASPLFAVGAIAMATGLWRTGRVPGLSRLARPARR